MSFLIPIMKTPYQILNINPGADDTEIKQAYLQQAKQNPPDHDQEQFQVIHNAYTAIKDQKSRLSHELFSFPSANFNQFIDQALKTEHTTSLTAENFIALLNTTVDDSTILNAIATTENNDH